MSADFLDALKRKATLAYQDLHEASFCLFATTNEENFDKPDSDENPCKFWSLGDCNPNGTRTKFWALFVTEHVGDFDVFQEFCSEAGAALRSNPPSQFPIKHGCDADTLWLFSLFNVFPSSREQIEPRAKGCQILSHPWAATIAAINDWQADRNGTLLPIGSPTFAQLRSNRKGAPKQHDAAEDLKLIQHWQAAKRKRTSREQFCKGRDISVSELIQAQDRERGRRRRAE